MHRTCAAALIGLQLVQMNVGSAVDTIYAFYYYPKGPNPLVELNLDTWRRHMPDMKLVLVNDSNIHDLVPDLPEEYYHIGETEKSDLIRAAVLYHQGGLYMDTDFLVMKPLTDVLSALATNDVVAYSTNAAPTGRCPPQFTSNFMAARKGNEFSRIWWTNIKTILTRVCERDGYDYEKLCCHQEGDTEQFRKCHVPWATIEHLKTPMFINDAKAKPTPGSKTAKRLRGLSLVEREAALSVESATHAETTFIREWPSDLKLWCFQQNEGFAPGSPAVNGELYWQPWDRKGAMTDAKLLVESNKTNLYDDRFECAGNSNDLSCSTFFGRRQAKTIGDFFGRKAHHLFFHSANHRKPGTFQSRDEILRSDWLLSELYRRSFDYGSK